MRSIPHACVTIGSVTVTAISILTSAQISGRFVGYMFVSGISMPVT